jgi:hypothetical protein
MSAIAIWYNEEDKHNPNIWVASDSRVSSSTNILIEDAAKIFSLPVICRTSDSNGFFTKVIYSHSYGFSFAGSTLMGQNLYLSLLPILSELIIIDEHPPSLKDVAEYVKKYLIMAFDDYKFRVGENAMVEVSIFGWCTKNQRTEIYHFYPKLENGTYQIQMEIYSNLKIGDYVYLGDYKDTLKTAIQKGFESPTLPGRDISRVPRHIIEDFIKNQEFKTIGGDIALGIGDKYGFRHYSIVKPSADNPPRAYISYLGREVTEDMRFVGGAVVGGSLML